MPDDDSNLVEAEVEVADDAHGCEDVDENANGDVDAREDEQRIGMRKRMGTDVVEWLVRLGY